MYAEAFFEKDVREAHRGRPAVHSRRVPAMPRWSATCSGGTARTPTDWEKTWELVDKKYRSREYYISALDVKLEGAFVLMGLLYGNGDPDQTIIISCRCGSDSDCNPSSSGGVLFTTLGCRSCPTATTASSTRRRSSATRPTTSRR